MYFSFIFYIIISINHVNPLLEIYRLSRLFKERVNIMNDFLFTTVLYVFSPFTPILIQYARVAGRNEWIGTVTLRIVDAKRCKRRLYLIKAIYR